LGGQGIEEAISSVQSGKADTAIILENDLYRRKKSPVIDDFLKACKHVVVLDHSNTPTTRQADYLIPAGTFSESDGIIVNNEGRAQRYFQVYETNGIIQESWRWLMNIGEAAGIEKMRGWRTFDDITKAIADEVPLLKRVSQITPPASYRINGQRIPREPHRFSGRTSMLSNVNVSEPKPPVDSDSSLSYTMEGFRGLPPSSMIPFFWSPGWNSVQSISKYQQEVGGSLRGGDPGIRLFEPTESKPVQYFSPQTENKTARDGQLFVVRLHHIFGSEELSAQAPSVAERSPKGYVIINSESATVLGIPENQMLSIDVDGQRYTLPVKLSKEIPKGVAGLPYGIPGLPFVELPAWGILTKL